MILSGIQTLPEGDISGACWSGIRRFQNISLTAKHIANIQSVPPHQQKNINKQAEQIRFCLIQASEYFKAANAVGLSTKPLLLYYGAMSFALAEILLKQSGDSSLDRARGQHAHHGLDLRLNGNPSGELDLAKSADLLRAVPLIKSQGERFGTFELWHRSAREFPIIGEVTQYFELQATQTSKNITLAAADSRLPLIPRKGISLLECFLNVPSLQSTLSSYGIISNLVRAKVERTLQTQPTVESTLTITIQPGIPEIQQKLYEQIAFHIQDLDMVDVYELPTGCIIKLKSNLLKNPRSKSWPNALQVNCREFYLCTNNESLNEFGVFYTGLFLLGNYARYYPEQWMRDVESSSPLSLIATDFMDTAEERIPILALSELSRNVVAKL